MNSPSDTGVQFLTIAEGARRLGVSGLRLREAALRGLVPFRRDNEGRMRIDLTGLDTLPDMSTASRGISAADLMGLLFDEVEDLHAALAAQDHEIVLLSELVRRQDAALEQAVGSAAAGGGDTAAKHDAALAAQLDRALALLETQSGDEGRLKATTQLLDRALNLADKVHRDAEARSAALQAELSATQEQLEKAVALSERAIESAAKSGSNATRPARGPWAFLVRLFAR